MKDESPARLTASTDPADWDLVRALNAAKEDVPTASERTELAAALAPFLAPAAGGAVKAGRGAPASLRPIAAGVASLKVATLALVTISGAVAGLYFVRHSSPAAAPPPSGVPRASSALGAPAALPPSAVPPTAATPSADPQIPLRRHTEMANPVVDSVPTASADGVPTGSVAFVDPAPSGVTETALLSRAERALSSDPAAALSLANEHRVRFPNGGLSQEREVIAIEALTALGRTSEAADRIAAFRRAFPGSAHLRRLDHLGGAPIERE